ncbi:hypothetical protein JOQ06_000258 [Pogonophryne albipinna]|uniref:Tyrosine specific protein phosphatases domain-containing protein n=1 Tax=Pogonophryne albipinna TaxID=1090488 RepID=A0AAD6AG10_9TELE|nr:hypothetical protein JOQ06_000258 [Pogonophryne albipinna]
MEDHLRNKDRLMKEWEDTAEPSAVSIAQSDANAKKNRCAQVKLKAEVNPSRSDYINASTIIEHDPRMPAYIATQGPLSHTISDWQVNLVSEHERLPGAELLPEERPDAGDPDPHSVPLPQLAGAGKVNKCYRGRSSPIIVHCSDRIGRTGTYILIDMDQFEFALTAVAEEVNAILKALPQ